MPTAEENKMLTRVGPGTPCGELLRRYRRPVAIAKEISDENPVKFVRILGEDLALFRDKKGGVGLLADHMLTQPAAAAGDDDFSRSGFLICFVFHLRANSCPLMRR